jgi:biotin operon repressor
MSKDKFKKRKMMRRRIRWAMEDLGITGAAIAAQLGITRGAVSKGLATSPRVVAALKEAGVAARLFEREAGNGGRPAGRDAHTASQGVAR